MIEPERDRGLVLARHPANSTIEQSEKRLFKLVAPYAAELSCKLVPEALVTILIRLPGRPEGDVVIAPKNESIGELQAMLERSARRLAFAAPTDFREHPTEESS
jgi:hypothetical protein